MNTSSQRAGQLIGCCAWGQGTIPGIYKLCMYEPILSSEFRKQPTAPSRYTHTIHNDSSGGTAAVQQQQQRHNRARAWSSGLCYNHGAFCVWCVCSVQCLPRENASVTTQFHFFTSDLKINFNINHTSSNLISCIHKTTAAAVVK